MNISQRSSAGGAVTGRDRVLVRVGRAGGTHHQQPAVVVYLQLLRGSDGARKPWLQTDHPAVLCELVGAASP